MGISSWSATASANTSINGVNIDEGCPAGNLNNGEREIMAAVRQAISDFALSYLNQTSAAAVRSILGVPADSGAVAAIGSTSPAADTVPYFTGSSSAATTALTSIGRALIAAPDAATARNSIGAISVAGASLTSPGYVQLALGVFGTLYIQWGITSQFGSEGAYSVAFPIAFPNACFAAIPVLIGNGTNSNDMWAQVDSVSSTGMVVHYQTTAGGNTGLGVHWIAVGN